MTRGCVNREIVSIRNLFCFNSLFLSYYHYCVIGRRRFIPREERHNLHATLFVVIVVLLEGNCGDVSRELSPHLSVVLAEPSQ